MIDMEMRDNHDVDIIDIETPLEKPSDDRGADIHENVEASRRYEVRGRVSLETGNSSPRSQNMKFHIRMIRQRK